MADTPDSGGGLAGLLGIFGRGYDPAAAYSGLLADPATKDAMTFRALAGMAGAFAEGAMPVPYRGGIPFAATLGKAGAAAYGGQDALIKARLAEAQSALAGSQGDVQKQNLLLSRAYLKNRMDAAAEDAAAGKGSPLGLLQGAGGTTTPGAGGGGGATTPGADGQTYWTPAGLDALQPTEGRWDQIHYPSGRTKDGVKSSASGGLGYIDSTWQTFAPKAGVDITKYPRAYMAPEEVQKQVALITPISHWTGVDANGKPFNAAAQKLATNPAFVTGGASSADSGAPGPGAAPAPVGMPPSLLAEVPNAAAQLAAPAIGAARGQLDAPPGGGLPTLPPGAGNAGLPAPAAPGPQGGLLTPPPGLGPTGGPPVSTAAAAPPPGPPGGLLGPTLPPEALASLGLVPPAGGRPAQFAGPGAAGPAASAPIPPPPGPSGPAPPTAANLTGAGGLLAQPPRPITSPGAPPPSAGLQLPPLIPGAGAAAPPPAPPMPGPAIPASAAPQSAVAAPPGAPAAPIPGAPTVAQIKRARDDEALLTLMGKPVPASVSKVAAFSVDVALEAEKARVQQQYKIDPMRPGSGPSVAGQPPKFYTPEKQSVFNPATGRMEIASVTMQPNGPPTIQFTGVPSGPSAEETSAGTTRGTYATGAGIPGEPIMPGIVPQGIDPAKSMPSPANATRPIATAIPAITKQARTPDFNTYGKSQAEWIKEGGELSDAGVLAQRAQENLTQIARAFSMIETGTWQTQKQQFGGFLQALNIPVPDSLNQLEAVQLALHNNYKAQLATLAAATKRFTGGEYKVNVEAGTQPNIKPGANLSMLSTDLGLARQLEYLASDWNHAQTMVGSDGSRWVNPVSFKTAWTETNPLTGFVEQTRKELAPMIKGLTPEVPTLQDPSEINTLRPGDRYQRRGDPAGSYRTVPQPRQ